MARFVGRENVRKRLAPLAGEPGRTTYAGGKARIETAGELKPGSGLDEQLVANDHVADQLRGIVGRSLWIQEAARFDESALRDGPRTITRSTQALKVMFLFRFWLSAAMINCASYATS